MQARRLLSWWIRFERKPPPSKPGLSSQDLHQEAQVLCNHDPQRPGSSEDWTEPTDKNTNAAEEDDTNALRSVDIRLHKQHEHHGRDQRR